MYIDTHVNTDESCKNDSFSNYDTHTIRKNITSEQACCKYNRDYDVPVYQ